MMDKALQLLQNSNIVSECTLCEELCLTRTQTVYGAGNPNAEIIIVGEAPGEQEDKDGEPFKGKSGKLLDQIILACGWDRSNLYICNVIKCRPPKNRLPAPDEIRNCLGYLKKQIQIIKPKYILCLGGIASNTLIGLPIKEARGKWHDFHGYRVLCTYHPAYLIRSPQFKPTVWSDLQLLLWELQNE